MFVRFEHLVELDSYLPSDWSGARLEAWQLGFEHFAAGYNSLDKNIEHTKDSL